MKIIIINILLCFFAETFESKACSPEPVPFKELLNQYNQNDFIIVEGYFQSKTGKNFSSKFRVKRSSNSSIKIGQEYEVFEFGPFGSMCEMYEMKSNIKQEFIGKENTRLLIIYKNRSVNGKLVTPIFWDTGVNSSNNKIVSQEYDYEAKQYISYECTVSLHEIWKLILAKKRSKIALEWKIQTDETIKNK